ncbi:hypothetical protein CLF_109130 [Clonorchis sinensis]|uniref:Reverse transcriptase domain-containing protein n=1 Tax=Clonorchis sinensis TaxID=79923 RepID=G7YIZ5_CLOSI|nr:hypothetical protein CLF_109130 [Clonorchis sinensis]
MKRYNASADIQGPSALYQNIPIRKGNNCSHSTAKAAYKNSLPKFLEPATVNHQMDLSSLHQNDRQYGLLSHKPLNDCRLHFVETITAAYDDGLSTLLVHLDIQKAFDKVPDATLLHKRVRLYLTQSKLKSAVFSNMERIIRKYTYTVRLIVCSTVRKTLTYNIVELSNDTPVNSLMHEPNKLCDRAISTIVTNHWELSSSKRDYCITNDGSQQLPGGLRFLINGCIHPSSILWNRLGSSFKRTKRRRLLGLLRSSEDKSCGDGARWSARYLRNLKSRRLSTQKCEKNEEELVKDCDWHTHALTAGNWISSVVRKKL